MCYPPIIQSGGNYSLKFSAMSDKNPVHFGAIVCCLGARYKSYCSNIVRTLLVNPTDEVQVRLKLSKMYLVRLNYEFIFDYNATLFFYQANYNFLCQVEEELLKNLVPGEKLCDVYEKTVEYVKKEKPNLADKLIKSFGFVIGIEFREHSMVIGPKCSTKILKGMVFNVSIGFDGLKNSAASDEGGKRYALFVGDTVIINEVCETKLY